MSSDEQGFRVYRQVDSGGYSVLQTLPDGSAYAEDADVVLGHLYDYYVTSFNAVGESAPSNVATVPLGA
jgi:hypothetical protein